MNTAQPYIVIKRPYLLLLAYVIAIPLPNKAKLFVGELGAKLAGVEMIWT